MQQVEDLVKVEDRNETILDVAPRDRVALRCRERCGALVETAVQRTETAVEYLEGGPVEIEQFAQNNAMTSSSRLPGTANSLRPAPLDGCRCRTARTCGRGGIRFGRLGTVTSVRESSRSNHSLRHGMTRFLGRTHHDHYARRTPPCRCVCTHRPQELPCRPLYKN
jgi:hypothetical protein